MGLVTRCCGLTLAKSQASTRVAHFQSKAAGKTLEFSALALPFREGRGVKMNFYLCCYLEEETKHHKANKKKR